MYLITWHCIPEGYFHSQHHNKSNSQVAWEVVWLLLLHCYVSKCMHSGKENSAKLCTESSSKVRLFTANSVLILTPDGIHNNIEEKIAI
jgi:hypothetical protein